MATTSELRRVDYTSVLALSGSDEEHKPPSLADAFDDFCCSSEVCGGDVKGDYVDALVDAENVALVLGFPKRRGVAKVGLGGHEELKSDVSGGWGVVD